MEINIIRKRNGEDLQVELTVEFTIPYEGSNEWLTKLENFIEGHSI
jgi:hypothetical protein